MRTLLVIMFAAYVHSNECSAPKSICSRHYTTAESRVISWKGHERQLVLHCGSAPSCAGTALLRILLVHSLGYRNVTLRIGPHQRHIFAAKYGYRSIEDYNEVFVDVSSAWDPSISHAIDRFGSSRVSNIPARREVLARLTASAASTSECDHHRLFYFYANSTALQRCNFTYDSEFAPLYVVNDTLLNDVQENAAVLRNLVAELKQRVVAAGLKLEVRIITREQLLQKEGSLLFVDFNLYDKDITTVQPPPCHSTSSCSHELDPVIAMRVTDYVLFTWEPSLFELIKNFSPSKDILKEIIELTILGLNTTGTKNIEGSRIYNEAACKWVDENAKKFDSLRTTIINDTYRTVVFFCESDYNFEGRSYLDLINIIDIYLNNTFFTVKIHMELADCNNEDNMLSKLTTNYLTTTHQYRLLGVLIPKSAGVRLLAKTAKEYRLPVIAYDMVKASEAPDVWQLTPIQLRARAVALFIRACRWSRVAVLSEFSAAAQDFVQALNQENNFVIGEFNLTVTNQNLTDHLKDLWEKRARIFFVNADNEKAFEVLRTVQMMGWDPRDYVLITRDRLRDDMIVDVEYYTISPYARRLEDLVNAFKCDNRVPQFLKNVSFPWPSRHSTAIVDGLSMLLESFNKVWQRYPASRNDLRSTFAFGNLSDILGKEPISGATESIQFNNHALVANCMYIERRRGNETKLLDTWRVDMIKTETAPLIEQPPHDGRSYCILRHGDPFTPTCLDFLWGIGLITLLLLPFGALVVVRTVLLSLKRHDDAILRSFLLSRAQCSADLINWRIMRDNIKIDGILGSGHFGRVSLGRLKTGDTWSTVAVKELHEGASPSEESEFLREACTLASLSHENVVRLAGVCDDGGPPLLLTEVALFGDLLGYLSARRHLVESSEALDEAEHVSAAALTRLASEAAAALQHLAVRGVVHRDVRAANCLVDVRRSLKLADFGMARRTGAVEYVCMRREVVPVRWLAPEALARGAFSSASDVWALGVLLLELMTLGARPWGEASLDRVLRRLAAGERPPLPLDASPPVRALIALCWADVADRPTADQVRAYLLRHPEVLRPAFVMSDVNDADSGYGDTPHRTPSNSSSNDCYVTEFES